MPISITTTTGGTVHGNPFVGPIDQTAHVKADLSALSTNEVDADGYLKPGVPLTAAGILVGTSPAYVFGVVPEAVKIAADNATATLSAATDCFVAVGTVGQVSQDIIEDNLGRSLTADELAGFNRAGSKLVLIPT